MLTMQRLLIGGLLLLMAGCAGGAGKPVVSGAEAGGPSAVAAPSATGSGSASMPKWGGAIDGIWASTDGQFVATMNSGAPPVGSVAGCISQLVDGEEQCGMALILLGGEGSTYSFRIDSWGEEFSCFDWDNKKADLRVVDNKQLELEIQLPDGDPTTVLLERGGGGCASG